MNIRFTSLQMDHHFNSQFANLRGSNRCPQKCHVTVNVCIRLPQQQQNTAYPQNICNATSKQVLVDLYLNGTGTTVEILTSKETTDRLSETFIYTHMQVKQMINW